MTQKNATDNQSLKVLIDDKPIRLFGLIVLISTLGIFGLWSVLAPIDGAALATGFVTVKSHRKTVQHLDGGIVSQLLVKDGDIIKDPLRENLVKHLAI